MHPGHKDAGYYTTITGAYLGYKPSDTPKIYLHRIDVPPELLFNKASLADLDMLTSYVRAPRKRCKMVGSRRFQNQKAKKLGQKLSSWQHCQGYPQERGYFNVKETTRNHHKVEGKMDIAGRPTRWCGLWYLRKRGSLVDSPGIFLVLSLILRWFTKSLDFDNTFVQEATIDHEVYAFLSSMLRSQMGDKAALRLKKLLNGISVAPKLWHEHLLCGLTKLGFKHSSYDKCLLYREDMMLVTFVNGCGLAVRNLDQVDWFIDELWRRGYELHLEVDFTAFLGVAMEPQLDRTIHMHQLELI
jgi:hypothetical protein